MYEGNGSGKHFYLAAATPSQVQRAIPTSLLHINPQQNQGWTNSSTIFVTQQAFMSSASAILQCPKEKPVFEFRSQLFTVKRILIDVWRPLLKWGVNMEPCLKWLQEVNCAFLQLEPNGAILLSDSPLALLKIRIVEIIVPNPTVCLILLYGLLCNSSNDAMLIEGLCFFKNYSPMLWQKINNDCLSHRQRQPEPIKQGKWLHKILHSVLGLMMRPLWLHFTSLLQNSSWRKERGK